MTVSVLSPSWLFRRALLIGGVLMAFVLAPAEVTGEPKLKVVETIETKTFAPCACRLATTEGSGAGVLYPAVDEPQHGRVSGAVW